MVPSIDSIPGRVIFQVTWLISISPRSCRRTLSEPVSLSGDPSCAHPLMLSAAARHKTKYNLGCKRDMNSSGGTGTATPSLRGLSLPWRSSDFRTDPPDGFGHFRSGEAKGVSQCETGHNAVGAHRIGWPSPLRLLNEVRTEENEHFFFGGDATAHGTGVADPALAT